MFLSAMYPPRNNTRSPFRSNVRSGNECEEDPPMTIITKGDGTICGFPKLYVCCCFFIGAVILVLLALVAFAVLFLTGDLIPGATTAPISAAPIVAGSPVNGGVSAIPTGNNIASERLNAIGRVLGSSLLVTGDPRYAMESPSGQDIVSSLFKGIAAFTNGIRVVGESSFTDSAVFEDHVTLKGGFSSPTTDSIMDRISHLESSIERLLIRIEPLL